MDNKEFNNKIHESKEYKTLVLGLSDIQEVVLNDLLWAAFKMAKNGDGYIKKDEGKFIVENSVKFEKSIDFDLKENLEFVNYTIKFSSMRPYEKNAEEIFNRIKNDFKKLYK